MNKTIKKIKEKQAERKSIRYADEIAQEVMADFEERRRTRRHFEAQWQLTANFVMGNQHCVISPTATLEDTERDYFWQEREVYNHMAPILETRLAKLGRVRPVMSVVSASDNENDIKSAIVGTKVLNSCYNRLAVSEIISRATMWSEITGTVFYKVTWDHGAGKVLGQVGGKKVTGGDVWIDVCPPYEIFPSSLTAETVEECPSIIHAKAVPVAEIKRLWNIDIEGENLDLYNYQSSYNAGGLGLSSSGIATGPERRRDHAIVIERYTLPDDKSPNGELVIVSGSKLLYSGELPYLNGRDGERGYPFIRQQCLAMTGMFFGTSILERVIPIQRAYNAVKNRKHEYLNRIAMGVLAVEDGSVDVNNLEDEGLSPGKILLYRQGSQPPSMLSLGRVPPEFNAEEDRLFGEFVSISGVSEVMRNSITPTGVVSGVALRLLIEQDETRLSMVADNIRGAIRRMGQHIIRLFRQFACEKRLDKTAGENGQIELLAWSKSDLTSDEIIFETDAELSNTPAARQSMIFDLLSTGLLNDETGKLTNSMRRKILDNLGFNAFSEEFKDCGGDEKSMGEMLKEMLTPTNAEF
ncbi:MAG: hypothetical protein FWC80_01865 [Firmicutes bacterium]|nr:hypothetical protein [Bacillota bacterium]